ncbi:TolC family protein [Winogradskyella psychrotolerans]|uniref:TolC family protein n=1 Tax=Winogradskyella psychrotolerans TaxID=1344585 RepID=UPI001C06A212|nr:TolC family protein [Winogradskyella psychrotolerans]MBU2928913.1 TolC family protein [Winogradskyella psychrotolerans]
MKRFFIIITVLIFQMGISQEITTETSKLWSLDDCLEYALENNITIKDAALNKEQAEVDYSEARSSRLPNLYGTASETFSNGNSIDPITSDYVTDQIYSTNVSLNSSMTLFQGNQINNQIEQNELLLNQSVFLEEETKNNIIISILENYLQILYAKEGITIAENNLTASEKEVERAKARLDAGTIALSDYTEAQSQAATNKYAIITAKNTYQQYIIALKQLLELDPTEDIEIETLSSDVDYVTLQLDKMAIYNNALGIMPEINASKIGVEVSEKDLDIAKGAYLPTLSLVSSVGSGYTSVNDNNFSDQFDINFNQRISLSLNIPIFNRNATKAAVQSAQINIEKAQISQQLTEKEVYKKVETAYQNAISAQEQLVAAEASQAAAEQTYKLAQRKYELGALSTTDLVISQNTYTNAQQNYLQAKYLSILYHQLLQFYQGNEIKL